MVMDELSETEERDYLSFTEDYIAKQLENCSAEMTELRKYIYEQRHRTWDDFARASEHPEQNMQELTQMAMTEQRDVGRYRRYEALKENLERLKLNPYFARLDISEDGDTDRVYIGRRSLIDEDTSEIIVCDWRSDIASLFYDSEPGKTSYNCPAGKVDCDLVLKRQFVIREGKLQYMFDSDVAVADDVLIRELGNDSEKKLKTVVSTIQREQNEIIRNTTSEVCLVQGVAGSGKTSIALHRLAYLLYKYRDSLAAGNIVIFSPNKIFDSYISDVLPELGEDRVLQTSFYDIFTVYSENVTYGDSSSQAEKLFKGEITEDEIVAKGNREMCFAVIENAARIADKDILPDDIYYYDTLVCDKNELNELYFNIYKNYKHEVRAEKIYSGISERLENDFKKLRKDINIAELTEGGVIELSDEELSVALEEKWAEEKQHITDKLKSMFEISAERIYVNILKEINSPYYEKTSRMLDEGKLDYCDMPACTLIRALLGQIKPDSHIKHAVIDEAQDYPYIIYKLVAMLYPNSKLSVLGDMAQGIIRHLNGIGELAEIFTGKSVEYRELKKSYRSTVEINEFAAKYYDGRSDFTFFERHGEPVKTIKKSRIADILTENSSHLSKAVICKNFASCKKVYDELTAKGFKLTLLGKEDILYPDRTIVVPSYLTKGLEFDVVIIADCEKKWKNASEKKALYVSCSRALHKLYVCED